MKMVEEWEEGLKHYCEVSEWMALFTKVREIEHGINDLTADEIEAAWYRYYDSKVKK